MSTSNVARVQTFTPDYLEAGSFLDLLDPNAPAFRFQTFDDSKLDRKALVATPYGKENVLDQLARLNNQGAGIFVTVNDVADQPRKNENVRRIRAILGDFDQGMPVDLPLAPSVIVRTSVTANVERLQLLWLCDGITLAEFSAIMEQHVVGRFGADKGAKDLARVLRVPGFFHLKDRPQRVEMIDGNRKRYTRDEILKAFPVTAGPDKAKAPADPKQYPPLSAERAQHLLRFLPDSFASDYEKWVAVGQILKHELGRQGFELFDQFSQRCPEKYDPAAVKEKWAHLDTGGAGGRLTAGTLIKWAKEHGYGSAADELGHGIEEPLKWPRVRDTGKPIGCADNLAILLDRLGVSLRFNEFSGRKTVRLKGQSSEGELNDAGLNWLLDQARTHQLPMTRNDLVAFTDVLARKATHHPVQDYLGSLRWDGTPRLADFAKRYLGAEGKPIEEETVRRWLIAAVKRVHEPGCKFDQILVLEGPQGIGKSQALAILGGEWFTDQVALGADSKAMIESTQGKWLAEIPELKAVGREWARIKAQLSTTADRARLAYAQLTSEVPRQFVMAATSNPIEYLGDPTGHRRFWPIACTSIDLTALRADRDQIWAEVMCRYRDGEGCMLDPKWYAAAAEEQAKREHVTRYEEILSPELDGLEGWVPTATLWSVLEIRSVTEQRREGASLSAIMQKLGWKRHQRRINSRREWGYAKGQSQNVISLFAGGLSDRELGASE